MMMALTPLATHSSTAASHFAAGITMTARSTAPGYVRQPWIATETQDLLRVRIDRDDRALEAVRHEVEEELGPDLAAPPARPDDGDDLRLEEPLHRGSGRAARTVRRSSPGSAASASARRPSSRRPPRNVCVSSKPQLRKTPIIRRFCARTSASKTWMPRARAISASRSRSRVPMPCPWKASSTVKAASARSGRSVFR